MEDIGAVMVGRKRDAVNQEEKKRNKNQTNDIWSIKCKHK